MISFISFGTLLADILSLLSYYLFVVANVLQTTITLGATLHQGTHIANLPLLAGAYTYGIPSLSKNMQKAVKSL